MVGFFSGTVRAALILLGMLILAGGERLSAANNKSSADADTQTNAVTRMNCGAQIECVTPDGRAGQVSRLPGQDPAATALIMDDDTVTCVLQEGETNFVIELPRTAVPDRFTFLNENAGARGELKIAVANHRLPANSPEWTEVEGIVPFSHKRLFGVSLLGIEARFVRVSFHVEKEGRIATRALFSEKARPDSGDRSASHAQTLDPFQSSSFEEALSSHFAALHARDGILLTANSPSVSPLPPMPRD